MDILTNITKKTGSLIARIQANNVLLDKLHQMYNPRFSEIIVDLKETDPSLATLLLLWYNKKYSEDIEEIDDLLDTLRNYEFEDGKLIGKKPKYPTVTCGIEDEEDDDYSGCGNKSGYMHTGKIPRHNNYIGSSCGADDSHC